MRDLFRFLTPPFMTRRGLAPFLGAVLLATGASAWAGELTLEPVLLSAMDQHRIVVTPDGGAAVLLQDALLRAAAGQDPAPVAVCSPDQSLALADNGSAYGVTTHRKGAADFVPTATFGLRAMNGDLLWSLGVTEDVAYVVSSQQRVVGLSLNINIAERNRLHFYGSDGRMLKEVNLPLALGGRFSPDGSIFFASTGHEELHAFDPNGASLWTASGCRLFASTPDGAVVAAIGGGQLKLIRDGCLAGALNLGDLLVRRVAIAPDASRIAIAGKHEVRVYRADGLVQSWMAETESAELSVTSVDIAADAGWTAVGVARDLGPQASPELRHPDGEVRLYDAGGTLRHHAPLAFDAWNIFSPTAILARDGRSMTITTRRAVFRADLP